MREVHIAQQDSEFQFKVGEIECISGVVCILYPNRYTHAMKPVEFLGDSLKIIGSFPRDARQNVGRQLGKVQKGNLPDSFKPMPDMAQESKKFGFAMNREFIG